MKKLSVASLVFLSLFFIPLVAGASLNTNLSYGLQNNSDVKELQEYLIGKGFLTGSATGNFYSLTLNAVKKYQASVGINQTGYVGSLTRQSINTELDSNLSDSNQEATNETGTTPPVPEPQKTTNDVVSILQAQITLLMQQLKAMQAQQTTTQQIQQNTQQIAQNTAPQVIYPPTITPTPQPLVQPITSPIIPVVPVKPSVECGFGNYVGDPRCTNLDRSQIVDSVKLGLYAVAKDGAPKEVDFGTIICTLTVNNSYYFSSSQTYKKLTELFFQFPISMTTDGNISGSMNFSYKCSSSNNSYNGLIDFPLHHFIVYSGNEVYGNPNY